LYRFQILFRYFRFKVLHSKSLNFGKV
jgi:hypothetical protein